MVVGLISSSLFHTGALEDHVVFNRALLLTLSALHISTLHAAGVPDIKKLSRQALVFEHSSGGYVARSAGFAVRLGPKGADLTSVSEPGAYPVNVSMRLAGRSQLANPEGIETAPGTVNYLIGPASRWKTDVAAYNQIRYANVYQGIDLVFYGRGNRLEYDFKIQPGADPSLIQVRWRGARRLTVAENGDLVISTAGGQIRWNAPLLYQDQAGDRNPVQGSFKLLGGDKVGFRVGSYDTQRELIIDPTLVFGTYLGGLQTEYARATAVDGSGNLYVAGLTTSVDLPVTKGVEQSEYAGNTANYLSGDAFVAKYTPTGALAFLTYLGGRSDDMALAIAVDGAGNAYVTGFTNSPDFPTTAGAFQTKFGGFNNRGFLIRQGDAFVSKLSPDGKSLIYSTYLGGSGDDAAFGIAVDGSGNAFVAGTTASSNFPVTQGAYQPRFAGSGSQAIYPRVGGAAIVGGDVFVTKLNPDGSALSYSTYIGGSSDDVANALTIDKAGNAYVGGYTLSSNFPTTSGALKTTYGGTEFQNSFFNFGDGFLLRLNATGSSLVYSTLIGGSGDDVICALVVDALGNVYATGATTSTDFPVTSGAFQLHYRGPNVLPFAVDQLIGDAFALKLNTSGTGLVFSTYLGGRGDDWGMGIALSGNGNPIVAGYTNSIDFPVTADAMQKKLAGPPYNSNSNRLGDGFLFEMDPIGNLTYSTFLGGADDDAILALSLSPSGTAFVAGATASQDLIIANAAQPKSGGRMDAFVAAISGFGAASGPPVISSVVSATGRRSTIAENTWTEIHGQNLASNTRTWQGPDFINNQLPTQLDGVKATVNGKPAFVYYISSQQVNVLTPLDSTTGEVQVQLTNSAGTSNSVQTSLQAGAPGFFQFSGVPYVAATHANGSLIGPASLIPGLTTPAKLGEEIVVYGSGFGQTSPAIVNGSEVQQGKLPSSPKFTIGGSTVKVKFAGVISPGLYQFNIVVPENLSVGDHSIEAVYNGFTTQPGALITVKN
jgi:uncharacterized protein (TIGR03437 family)